MPMYHFDGASYPTYVDGCGYAMDRSAATCLYQEAMQLPYLFLEDVFVNGFARQECGNVRIDHSDLFIVGGRPFTAITGKEVLSLRVQLDRLGKLITPYRL